MSNVTVRVPDELKRTMESHPEVNWSEVARQSFQEYAQKLELVEQIEPRREVSKEEIEELSRKVKRDLAEHYE
ncbi:MAG: hypothetical protein MAG715_01291 [Methanonatronarchaeales archaeon]|nr:hypothetical protein [Methanonatronarchaeales archaeon]